MTKQATTKSSVKSSKVSPAAAAAANALGAMLAAANAPVAPKPSKVKGSAASTLPAPAVAAPAPAMAAPAPVVVGQHVYAGTYAPTKHVKWRAVVHGVLIATNARGRKVVTVDTEQAAKDALPALQKHFIAGKFTTQILAPFGQPNAQQVRGPNARTTGKVPSAKVSAPKQAPAL